MKIMHISLSGEFTDGLSYQDNLLTKYQVRDGHQVRLVVSCWSRGKDGNLKKVPAGLYENTDGVEIVRLEMSGKDDIKKRIRKFPTLSKTICDFAPDIIFHHGCQSIEESTVAKYLKQHRDVKLFMDNHADYSNSARNFISKNIQHRILWKHYIKKIDPYVIRYWGVLPARVDFIEENYGLPQNKCGLLVMGADDDEVKRARRDDVRKRTRSALGFRESDFVVVTGGKIDLAKKQTLLLMDAIKSLGADFKLLVFGPVVEELKEEVRSRIIPEKIVYVPWADSSQSYDYFSTADVIVFPGRHSVYWEQAAAMGKPLIVKSWPGTQHVVKCGNALLLEEDDEHEISSAILAIRNQYDSYLKAATDAADSFLYSKIAEKSICVDEE